MRTGTTIKKLEDVEIVGLMAVVAVDLFSSLPLLSSSSFSLL